MPPNNPMTEGEALAVDDDAIARVFMSLRIPHKIAADEPITPEDWFAFGRACAALTAHTAASGGEVVWPKRMVNLPCPEGTGDRIIGFRVPDGDPILGDYGLSEPLAWFRKVTIDRVAAPPAAVPADRGSDD